MPKYGIGQNLNSDRDKLDARATKELSDLIRAYDEAEIADAQRKAEAEQSSIAAAQQLQDLNNRLDELQKHQTESDRKNRILQIINIVLVILTLIATIVIGWITISQNARSYNTQLESAITDSVQGQS